MAAAANSSLRLASCISRGFLFAATLAKAGDAEAQTARLEDGRQAKAIVVEEVTPVTFPGFAAIISSGGLDAGLNPGEYKREDMLKWVHCPKHTIAAWMKSASGMVHVEPTPGGDLRGYCSDEGAMFFVPAHQAERAPVLSDATEERGNADNLKQHLSHTAGLEIRFP